MANKKRKSFVEKEVELNFNIKSVEVAEGDAIVDQIFIETDLPTAGQGKESLELVAVGNLGDSREYVEDYFKVKPLVSKIHLRESDKETGPKDTPNTVDTSDTVDTPPTPMRVRVSNSQVIRAVGYPDQVLLHTDLPPLMSKAKNLVLIFMADESTGVDYVKENFGFIPEIVNYNPKRA